MINLQIGSRIAFTAVAGFAAFIPGAAQAKGFDGPYAGVEAGLSILDAKGATLAGPFDETDEAAFVGGLLGYRTPVSENGGLIVGLEGDLGVATDGGDVRYGVSGIAGVKLGGSSLLYGRVGYAGRDGLPEGTGDGVMFGGGFETRLAERLNLRLDYKYIDLGSIDFTDNMAEFTEHEITGGLVLEF